MEKIIMRPPHDLCGYYQFGKKYVLSENAAFVFGSNNRGAHGKGAALTAVRNFDAQYGVGEGLMGRSYAIPTKDKFMHPRKLEDIIQSIRTFVSHTQMSTFELDHEYKTWYYVTPIGTGLAGFKHEEIAPHFQGAANCWFPDIWRPYLGDIPGIYLNRQNDYKEKYGYDLTEHNI